MRVQPAVVGVAAFIGSSYVQSSYCRSHALKLAAPGAFLQYRFAWLRIPVGYGPGRASWMAGILEPPPHQSHAALRRGRLAAPSFVACGGTPEWGGNLVRRGIRANGIGLSEILPKGLDSGFRKKRA